MADSRTLSYTAEQIDAILAAAQRCSNRNLLDNWYFANPVDQRGGYVVPPGLPYRKVSDYSIVGNTDKYYTASYINDTQNPHFYIDGVEYYVDHNSVSTAYVRGYTGAGYGIDRWCSHEVSNTTLIYDDHITITRQHAQIIDNYHELVGRQVTISALTNLGPLVATGVCTNNDGGQAYYDDGNGHNIILYNNGSYHGLQVNNTNGGTLDLYGAKLELGTTQTLAHQENGNWVLNDLPLDKNMELLKCQRYYQLYSSADKRPVKAVDCRPTMRVDPVQGTIVIDRTTYYYNSAEL